MRRRPLLLALPLSFCAHAQNQSLPLTSPVDAVHFYVIPTDDISEQVVANIARGLTVETGLWVKSTLWTPPGNIEPFSGTNQYAAEDYFPLGAKAAKLLPEASPGTYFIVLTDRDINSRSRNFRFQFSMHSPMQNTSVLSSARLQYNTDGTRASPQILSTRVAKMLLRIVGEMRLGWKRVNDPLDLMYAPIMSVDDIDRMTVARTIQQRKQR